ncbi:MAG: aquaporin [Planctomycetes bacterium]|nr:aquaporin [Planctomycetota bacterium]
MGACVAEVIGTFALTFIGGGAILNGNQLLGIAIAHGLALCTMISALGHVSGGHFNPSVTLGLLSIGKIKPADAVAYWVAQFGGAVLAGLLLKSVFPGVDLLNATPHLTGTTSRLLGILVEAVLTFFLVSAVLGTAVDRNAPKIGGFGIGLTVTMDILMGGPITGAAMNQARWLGTGVFAKVTFPDGWVYVIGPAAGGVAAALVYRFLFSAEVRAQAASA